MGNSQAHDRHSISLMPGIRRAMQTKVEALRARQEALRNSLEASFDYDTFRELNIVNHRIAVAESRSHGDWMFCSSPCFPEIIR